MALWWKPSARSRVVVIIVFDEVTLLDVAGAG